MFHKFEPLQQKDPALTVSLEKNGATRRSRIFRPERMFWMGAGEKTTELNAYVTGIGASKRIVVWDNTIAKMNTPQIVYVAGHEMGHYVLNHIWKGLIFAAVFLFVLFYLGFRTIGWFLRRWGKDWGIRGVDDLASLPALLLLLSVFSFIANPINSAMSRHFEHQADQYGLGSDAWADAGFRAGGGAVISDSWRGGSLGSRAESDGCVDVLFASDDTGPDSICADLRSVGEG